MTATPSQSLDPRLLVNCATADLAAAPELLCAVGAALGGDVRWSLPPIAGGAPVALTADSVAAWIAQSVPGSPLTAQPGVVLQCGSVTLGTLLAPSADPAALAVVAPCLAGTLERWRRTSLAERTLAEKHLLVTLGQMTATYTDLSSLLRVTFTTLRTIVPLHAFGGMIYNPDTSQQILALLVDGEQIVEDTLVRPMTPTLFGWIIRNLQPLWFQDVTTELQRYPEITPMHYGTAHPSRSWLGVPMLLGDGRPVGALSIQHREPGRYTEHDLQFLREVATQAAVAVEKAILLQQRDRIISTLAAQVDLAEGLGQRRLVTSALEGALRAIERSFPEQVYTLMLTNSDRMIVAEWVLENGQLFVNTRAGQPLEPNGLMDLVTTEKRAVLFSSDAEWQARGMGVDLVGDASMPVTEAVIAAPLLASDGAVLGGVSVQSYQRAAFDQQQLSLLGSMAHHIALAVENARLIERSEQQVAALAVAYEQLKQTQHQLIEAERRRAIGDIAAGVAHDFNNLLGTMLGAAQLIDFAESVADAQAEAAVIAEAARDASVIVRRIQEFTKSLQPTDQTAIDLPALVQSVLELTRPRWRDEAQLHGLRYAIQLDLAPTPPIQGNVGELREVLLHLISNALDAMPQGGELQFRTFAEGDQAICSLTDSGVGISPEVLAHVGEPFFTTKGGHGSGLGLAVSQAVIRRHGGTLQLTSEGHGTTATFRLPLTQLSQQRRARAAGAHDPKPRAAG